MHSIDDLVRDALTRRLEHITREVFDLVAADVALLAMYNSLVAHSSADTVNQAVGRRIGEMLNLTPMGRRATPGHTLITSYTRHRVG